MNTYEGKFYEEEKLALDNLFDGFHFKEVGRKGIDEFYYADKTVNMESIHLSARTLFKLSERMLKLGLGK